MTPHVSNPAHTCLASADGGSPENNPGLCDNSASHLGWKLQTGQMPNSCAKHNGENLGSLSPVVLFPSPSLLTPLTTGDPSTSQASNIPDCPLPVFCSGMGRGL